MNRIHLVVLGGMAVVVMAFILLSWSRNGQSTKVASKITDRVDSRVAKPNPGYYVPPNIRPAPASTDAISKATGEFQLKSTLRNYRVALALGQTRLADALKRALLRDRTDVVRFAREEVDHAKTAPDHELALRTLESLEK